MANKKDEDRPEISFYTEGTPSEGIHPPQKIMIRVPSRHNPRLTEIIERVNADMELQTFWQAANINAVKRLGMSDHGPVHIRIVTNIALKLFRLLIEKGIQPNVVTDHNLTNEDGEIVVVLGAMFHDLGMAVQRAEHEMFSILLAKSKLQELLSGIYDIPDRTILISEILHAIISHRAGGRPFTLEAGIVRVSDALDMAEGRSRIPFEAGQFNIHSVSAAAIEQINIEKGETKPIRIVVKMNNSAGIYQLDELLKEKLEGSGMEPYVEVEAAIEGEAEKKLIKTFKI